MGVVKRDVHLCSLPVSSTDEEVYALLGYDGLRPRFGSVVPVISADEEVYALLGYVGLRPRFGSVVSESRIFAKRPEMFCVD